MTRDHVIRSFHRGPYLEQVATVCGVVIALATIPLAVAVQRQAALARTAAWTASGPPCPVMSRAAYKAFGAPVSNIFDYDGVWFARAYGNATCGKITADRLFALGLITVCQFNNPTVVEVATPRAQVFFMTGVRPATILVEHGQPSCVLAAKLSFDWMRR
jgi:hypothetical protein